MKKKSKLQLKKFLKFLLLLEKKEYVIKIIELIYKFIINIYIIYFINLI